MNDNMLPSAFLSAKARLNPDLINSTSRPNVTVQCAVYLGYYEGEKEECQCRQLLIDGEVVSTTYYVGDAPVSAEQLDDYLLGDLDYEDDWDDGFEDDGFNDGNDAEIFH